MGPVAVPAAGTGEESTYHLAPETDTLICPTPASRKGRGGAPRLPSLSPRTLLAAACAAALLFGGMHVRDRALAAHRDAEAEAVRRIAKGGAVTALVREARAKPRLDPQVWNRLLKLHSPELRRSLARALTAGGTPTPHSADDASALLPEVRAALNAAKGPARAPEMLSALAARKRREAGALRVSLPLPWGEAASRRGVPSAALKSFLLISAAAAGAAALLPYAAMLLLGVAFLARAAVLRWRRRGEIAGVADASASAPVPAPAPAPAERRGKRRRMVPEAEATRLAAERDRLQAQLAALLAELDGSTGEEDKLRAMRRRVAEAERRAEEAERRLRAAAAERDVAMQSLHRAAEAAASAARVALGAAAAPQRKPLEGE